jgi:hypothetical protein
MTVLVRTGRNGGDGDSSHCSGNHDQFKLLPASC